MNAEHIDASGEVLAARDADRAQRAREARDERIQERRHGKDLVFLKRVSINAPHKAVLDEGNLAITVAETGAGGDGGSGTVELVACGVNGPFRANFVIRGAIETI